MSVLVNVPPDAKAELSVKQSTWGQAAKAWFYVLATIVLLAASGGLALVVERHWSAIHQFDWSRVRWGMVAAGGALYGISLITTASAWPTIVTKLGGQISVRDALPIGLAAQLGKYIPGSVGHYLGRAALAKRFHVTFRQSGESTLVELMSAVIAGALVAGTALAANGPLTASIRIQPIQVLFFGVIGLALLTAVTLAARKWISPRLSSAVFILPVAWLCLSFAFAGASLYILILALGSHTPFLAAVGIYAVAWIAGFAIPGAPAGLGVREAVLVLLLGVMLGGATALLAAAAHRILTAAIDALAALAGVVLLLMRDKVGTGNA